MNPTSVTDIHRDPDTVRREARAELDGAGISIAAAAREMGLGVSPATLSRWLSGQYDGDSRAVARRVGRWLNTRREARERALGDAGLDRYVPLGVTEEVQAALALAQSASDIVLIHGRSGAGKTWAAQHYAQSHSGAHVATMSGAVSTLPGLLGRVAQAVGAGARYRSAAAAEEAVIQRLAGRRALLIVDEAHHLGPKLIDELRCVRDMAGCGLALIGGEELWGALVSARGCEQIIGRITVRLPLGAAPVRDALELAAAALDRRPTAGEERALRSAARGAGGLHAVRRLLERAWLLARAEGRKAASNGDVKAAAKIAA